jgi:hypothetical protein
VGRDGRERAGGEKCEREQRDGFTHGSP